MKKLLLILLLLSVALSACGIHTRDTIELHGYVVNDVRSVVTLYSSGEGTSSSGKNIVHLLVAFTSDSNLVPTGREVILKIQDKKGANLKPRDGIKLFCEIDVNEKVGDIYVGFELDGCRLQDPFADYEFDGFADDLDAAIRNYGK